MLDGRQHHPERQSDRADGIAGGQPVFGGALAGGVQHACAHLVTEASAACGSLDATLGHRSLTSQLARRCHTQPIVASSRLKALDSLLTCPHDAIYIVVTY